MTTTYRMALARVGRASNGLPLYDATILRSIPAGISEPVASTDEPIDNYTRWAASHGFEILSLLEIGERYDGAALATIEVLPR